MATSGSIDYKLTARGLVTQALRKIGVMPVYQQSANADDMAQGVAELNMMLKGWQLHGPNLWRQTEGSLALTATTASYTLSPRPHRVIECRYRDANGRDLPMEELTREEYFEMPLKTATGIPTQFYFDPQVSSGKLYIWPVMAAVTSETIKYTYSRVFEDIDDVDDDIDVPQELTEVVMYGLADRLQNTYGLTNDRITLMAQTLFRQAESMDREPVIRFRPERRWR